jgi:ribose transport system ATP-binding protein
VLVLSSDVEEVAGLSDRSIIIDRGRVVARFDRGAAPSALMAATSAEHAAHAMEPA